jgi:hypothetical protein
MDFYEKYISYTDEQLLEVLKNHKDYQDSAVDAAVKIAIERQLIHSEQDLFSPEFQDAKIYRNRMFPEIPNDFQREKLAGSIFRFLYLMSILPLVFGFLKYAEGQYYMTAIGLGIAVIWFLLSFLLARTKKTVVFIPLFILLFSISLYIGTIILSSSFIKIMDLVMLIVGLLLPTYLLLLLRKLIQTKL